MASAEPTSKELRGYVERNHETQMHHLIARNNSRWSNRYDHAGGGIKPDLTF